MNKLELIGRLIDNTYNPASKSGSYSLKGHISGDSIILRFKTIVHFASEKSLRPQVQSAKEHSVSLMKDFLDKLKKKYKDASGESLKLKELNGDDNLEIIQSTSNSPRKVAYYRCNQVLEIK